MKKKTLFSMLGVALCSMGITAQTYKLHDMTSEEFEAGGNQHFSFSEYRLASGTYSPLTVYSDSGRVNYFDIYLPECFQTQVIGTKSASSVAAEKSWYEPLFWSLSNKKVNLTVGKSNDASSFIYVANINGESYETYPTLLGTVALEFKVPADGYYKFTSTAIRQDFRPDVVGNDSYLMAKFRFRQNGEKWVDQSSTLGFDYKFGGLADGTEFSYDKEAMGGNGAGIFTYYKTNPTPHIFYAYLKAGDIITAESDISHKYKTNLFMDSTNYWARDAWGRTRWTQFDAEVVTKEVAEAQENFVNPYEAGDEDYVKLLRDLVDECSVFAADAGLNIGEGVGQFDQADVDAFNLVVDEFFKLAEKEGLISFTAKVYYGKLQKEFEVFKAKAHTIDFDSPDNCWLFLIPETSTFYSNFEKQFAKTDANSPWDFKSYTVSSGIYNALANFDTGNKSGIQGWYDNAGDWFYIAKNGGVHPLATKSPVITFKAAADGLYHAATTVQRDPGNKNKNYMYTRYRFVKGGIEDGITSVDKESFMFSDAYGNADNNVPVSRDFYVKMKAGDVITFEEDAYTTNSNGSAGTTWQKLMVLKVPADQEESTIEANKDSYFDAYALANDFHKLDSVINAVDEGMATVQVTDDPNEVGKYPSAAKYEVDDALDAAKEIDRANATQYEVDKMTRDLSAVYAKFLTTLQIRYEKEETLASGPYYITKDGMVLTTDTYWTSGTEQPAMFAHLQPLAEPTGVKNNQVFDIQFNAEAGNEDPLRYTLQCVPKDETWIDSPAYHITETGQVREGDKSVAQSTTGSNNTWRNHSLIYDGTNWCIYNVYKKTSLIFDADVTKRPATSGDKLYLYKLIPMDKIGDWRSIEEVSAAATTAQIVAITTEGGAELYGTEEMRATVYNAAGGVVMEMQLSTSATRVNLPAGFYMVKAANGATAKMIVK